MIPMMKRDGDKMYYWLCRRDGNLVGFHSHDRQHRDHHGPNPGVKVQAKKNVDRAALKRRPPTVYPNLMTPLRIRVTRSSSRK